MLHFYLEQLVMMFSLVSDGSHRERIQLMECNLEQKKAKEMKKEKSMIDTQSQNNNNFHAPIFCTVGKNHKIHSNFQKLFLLHLDFGHLYFF